MAHSRCRPNRCGGSVYVDQLESTDMVSSLIGSTGFVGGNLKMQFDFEQLYNSANVSDMAGQRYSLIVCCGVSAAKWLANKEPVDDRRRIARLERVLEQVNAERFVLISTVDVYPSIAGVDETSDCHRSPNHAYGTNRLAFEDFVLSRFPKVHILRLSGLFGPGLKKNVIFDLMNDNALDAINPAGRLQWYDTTELWADICRIIDRNIPLINLVNEPLATSEIIGRYFPGKVVGTAAGRPVAYDIRCRHASELGGSNGYLRPASIVLEQLGRFLARTAA